MGRKRTSNKERILISVDKKIIEKLRELEVDRSLIFTEAALELLKEYEEDAKKEE